MGQIRPNLLGANSLSELSNGEREKNKNKKKTRKWDVGHTGLSRYGFHILISIVVWAHSGPYGPN